MRPPLVVAELLSTPTASVESQRVETEKRLGAVPELVELGLGPLFRSNGPGMSAVTMDGCCTSGTAVVQCISGSRQLVPLLQPALHV